MSINGRGSGGSYGSTKIHIGANNADEGTTYTDSGEIGIDVYGDLMKRTKQAMVGQIILYHEFTSV